MAFRIARHDTSDVVQLSDGSRWRIWPADVATTLQWFPPQNWRLSRSKMNSALTCSSIVRTDREFESSTNVRVGHQRKSGVLWG